MFSNEPTSTEAGGHPDVLTAFEIGNRFDPKVPCECNDPKNVTIHAPAGVVANPHVVSECTAAELSLFACPPEAQVGFIVLRISGFGNYVVPLYRTVPQAGQGALFAFSIPLAVSVPQYTSVTARTGGDFGLDFKVLGLSHAVSIRYFGNFFWGVPGEQGNDLLRFAPGEKSINCKSNPIDAVVKDIVPTDCQAEEFKDGEFSFHKKAPVDTSLPIEPFTQAPTTCVGPLSSSIETLAYDGESASAEALWPATTGCDKLTFDPSLSANPTTTQADAPSGLAVDLKVPQYQDPETPSPSEIRATTVTLPEGFSINPNAADGKTTCSDAQANFTNEEPAECPEFSKVGTTTLDSSALPGPIPGYIYLADPKPGDRYRIILTASGFGTHVKIPGSIEANSSTGQLVASFQDLPQAPFQEFDLHFFGSERGLLATPTQCGTYAVQSTFTPWASELSDQTSTQFFTLDSGPGGRPCPGGPRPFDPFLQAGVADNTAGLHSPFVLRLDRPDGDQNVSTVRVKTPPGFAATLKGIPYCPDAAVAQLGSSAHTGLAEQAISSCPQASQIGTARTSAGAGSRPIHVAGKVYLAGPYKGAPLSLLVVVPAVSGPYDLGNVAVRAAIDVDPTSAQVTTVSDPLPQILEGVPLRTRSIQVNLDRPGFALNPTDCDPFSVETMSAANEGAHAPDSVHFQVANCAVLPFSPKLSLKISGSIKRRGHPTLKATVAMGPGEANLSRTVVALPGSLLLDNGRINTICTRVQFAAEACPVGSQVGSAEAVTPLLDRPLSGPVYLRSSNNKLPDMVVDLEGQIDIELSGRIDKAKGAGLRTSFETIPDAPVSKFTLTLPGGSKGLLQNSENVCKASLRAEVQIGGQNGAVTSSKPRLQTPCRAAKKRPKRHNRGAAR